MACLMTIVRNLAMEMCIRDSSKTTPNRKALPKFLKWLLISAVFGFCVGIASGILDDLDVGVWLTDGLIRLLTVIAPWGIPISSVVLLGICLWHYRSAKSLFDRWDGEDDSAPEEADRKLNVVVLCSTRCVSETGKSPKPGAAAS